MNEAQNIIFQLKGVCVAQLIYIDAQRKDLSYYKTIVDQIMNNEEAKVIIYYGPAKHGKLYNKQNTDGHGHITSIFWSQMLMKAHSKEIDRESSTTRLIRLR